MYVPHTSRASLISTQIASRGGHLDLCEFLLMENQSFREDATLQFALNEFVRHSHGRLLAFGQARKQADSFYRLFIEKYEMTTESDQTAWNFETVLSNMMLTEQSVRYILASQLVSSTGLSFPLNSEDFQLRCRQGRCRSSQWLSRHCDWDQYWGIRNVSRCREIRNGIEICRPIPPRAEARSRRRVREEATG